MAGGGGTDSGDSGCPGPAAAGGPDPSQPRGGEPCGRAAGGRTGKRAAFVPVGLSAKGTRWRAGPGSSRPGGWRSGAAGLKVRQAAGRARGGLRAAPWLGAPAGARGSLGASPEASPGSGRRGRATRTAGEEQSPQGVLSRWGRFSCLWRGGALG